ncbi:hypothetical protein ARMSODRAFT_487702 [Armillaria solidipes]|uniref:Uncharacterized protein n=1 Tax=Armillaria solidipes TaxID=1076256 RepID=A0A2H3BYM5_9AGAR|nr:hypothetical protein ARMSODRAFT_487702 [Armillaria solidipes]
MGFRLGRRLEASVVSWIYGYEWFLHVRHFRLVHHSQRVPQLKVQEPQARIIVTKPNTERLCVDLKLSDEIRYLRMDKPNRDTILRDFEQWRSAYFSGFAVSHPMAAGIYFIKQERHEFCFREFHRPRCKHEAATSLSTSPLSLRGGVVAKLAALRRPSFTDKLNFIQVRCHQNVWIFDR